MREEPKKDEDSNPPFSDCLSLQISRSATLPDVRTPYLRLRLPIIVRRVQRGEAKLVVNTAKLGEYLALAPEDINRLAPVIPGPLPERARPIRKRIDYVVVRAQYEQLLAGRNGGGITIHGDRTAH